MHVCTHTRPYNHPPPSSLWIPHALALRGVLLPGNEEEGGGEAGAAAGEQWATCGSFECLSTLVHLSGPPPSPSTFTSSHTVSPPPSSQTGVRVIPCLLPVNSPTPLHHFFLFFLNLYLQSLSMSEHIWILICSFTYDAVGASKGHRVYSESNVSS